MDWLRSEDLKEVKVVIASIFIIALTRIRLIQTDLGRALASYGITGIWEEIVMRRIVESVARQSDEIPPLHSWTLTRVARYP